MSSRLKRSWELAGEGGREATRTGPFHDDMRCTHIPYWSVSSSLGSQTYRIDLQQVEIKMVCCLQCC